MTNSPTGNFRHIERCARRSVKYRSSRRRAAARGPNKNHTRQTIRTPPPPRGTPTPPPSYSATSPWHLPTLTISFQSSLVGKPALQLSEMFQSFEIFLERRGTFLASFCSDPGLVCREFCIFARNGAKTVNFTHAGPPESANIRSPAEFEVIMFGHLRLIWHKKKKTEYG